jgi:uncharacterized BrkB/YihY/UPF0761 family membrane protein
VAFPGGLQLPQEAKKIINEDIDRALRDSSNLGIVKNIIALIDISSKIHLLQIGMQNLYDPRWRSTISFIKHFPDHTRGIIIFVILVVLLLSSSLKISFDYSAFGCPPHADTVEPNFASLYPGQS